ncbi:MAG: PIN domain-containing protein [Thermoguttaceae bacterium]|nr:PIN domain-containing protein [Thermoguttaceae bacterium]MBR5758072.1 PIN domain-containing protein [Thermoguttaceae bacterium]
MRVLIDTNVMLDYLAQRPSFYAEAYLIMDMCRTRKIEGFVAAHSVMNAYYILRKSYSENERRDVLLNFLELASIVKIDQKSVTAALSQKQFKDVEDCLQVECALACDAKYIVTRNLNDFQQSIIKAITPGDFIKSVLNGNMRQAENETL